VLAVYSSEFYYTPLENGRFSDRNRIAADTRVSNRIEIGRNK